MNMFFIICDNIYKCVCEININFNKVILKIKN